LIIIYFSFINYISQFLFRLW